MTTTTQAPKNLVEKAAAVLGIVEHVPKNGWNDFHKYKYATEADITSAVRSEMANQGLMLVPSVEKVEWSKVATKGGEDRLCTLTVKFTLTDGHESISFMVLGEGTDRSDKASYKAMTGALKYALLKLFLIPTGDDPEQDEEKPKPRGNTSNAEARDAVQKAAGQKPPPVEAYRQEALKEATRLFNGNEENAKRWLCAVREDPKGQRAWTEADCEKVKAAIAHKTAEGRNDFHQGTMN